MRLRIGVVTAALLGALALSSAARAAGPDATAYQLNAAHTGATSDPALVAPLHRAWAVDLGDAVSYPIIAGGRVFVTVRNTSSYGSRLVALDAATGAQLWSRSLGGTYYWSGLTYESGRVFFLNFDGLLMSIDAASGATQWATSLPYQWAFSSAPTASGGIVYAAGAGSGGTLYAVDEATGAVKWSQGVMNGDDSSPAVGAGRVHVGYACFQVYGFDALGGAAAWHASGPCEGGGGKTTVLYGGRVWARDGSSGQVYDAASGALVDGFGSRTVPAFGGGYGFLVSDLGLEAVNYPALTTRWSVGGDTATSAPIVVDGTVYEGFSDGTVAGFAVGDGTRLWSDDAGAPIPAPDEQNVSQPLTGMAEGGGLLVVPTTHTVVAYASGAAAPTAGGGGQGGTTTTTTSTGTTASGPAAAPRTASPGAGTTPATSSGGPALRAMPLTTVAPSAGGRHRVALTVARRLTLASARRGIPLRLSAADGGRFVLTIRAGSRVLRRLTLQAPPATALDELIGLGPLPSTLAGHGGPLTLVLSRPRRGRARAVVVLERVVLLTR